MYSLTSILEFYADNLDYFNFFLASIIVLLFTLFGASFCDRTRKELASALSSAQSNSEMAALMQEVAKYCEKNGNSMEADNARFMAKQFMPNEWYFSNAQNVKAAENCLLYCVM
ncbi:uncharacterized protein LOC141851491 [Brevipalpus obovatus]|uniref:uncharacterized protein LOC141851491 n=1 Tax=Brevipalpus obovatus TaxID=246614 RepID=UPI003D9F3127